LVVSIIADLAELVTAPRVQLALRRERTAMTRFVTRVWGRMDQEFRSAMSAYNNAWRVMRSGMDREYFLAELLGSVSVPEGAMVAPDFWKPGDNDPLGRGVHTFHYGDFVNDAWSQASLAGNGALTLGLWRQVSRMMPVIREAVRIESLKVSVVEDARRVFLDKAMLGGRWTETVWRTFRALGPGSAVTACLSQANYGRRVTDYTDPLDVLSGSAPKLLTLYNCILNAIQDGKISLSESRENRAEHVATLMHVVWMARGPLAFILEVTGDA
jgi:hypothetical protein